MKNQESKSINRAPEGGEKNATGIDWSKVLRVVIKILTIGLYHVNKHRKEDAE